MDYAPTLEPQMLELLIDKALEIDVEIRIKDGGNVEIDEEKIVSQIDDEAIFELELDGDVPQKATAVNTEAPHQDNLLDRTIDEMAEKLDSIMVLLFRYVESRVENDPQALSKLFHILVPVFESTILTTHRSKFVQFILFYLCGIVPSDVDQPHDLYRDFAGRLIEAVLDPPEPL
ncbi:RNA polymerase I specific transcription initiation factor RRN3 [Fragilaria crotonensis]|nr:RNA polymerase I specific transcription initiation factor RRN3 [Fragilaria crotonensis]